MSDGAGDPGGHVGQPARPAGPPRARRRRRLLNRRTGIAALLLLLGWALWAGWAGLRAKSELEAVRADLVALREEPPDRAELVERLGRDGRRAEHAAGLMRQLGPRAAASVPLLGRSLDAERRVAEAAAAAVAAARDIEAATRDLGSAGAIDLEALQTAADRLERRARSLRGPMERLDSAPTSQLPGAVRRSVLAAQEQLGGLDGQLDRAAAAARALHGLLGGSGRRTVLVAVQNNAELRGTGGLISTFAIGTLDRGRLQLQPFRDVIKVLDPVERARSVPAPADYVAHYGPYRANSTLWRNVNMTPDAPTAAAVLAQVSRLTAGAQPDVVLLLDVPGLAAIVTATGPITLDGERVSGDELSDRLLVDAYVGAQDDAAQSERRARQERAADAALKDLVDAPASLALAKALADAAAGRHLALWSARPAEQAALEKARAAGSADASGVDVALAVANNFGDSPGVGNKLDYYVDRRLEVSVVVGAEQAEVTQTLTLANRAPSTLGSYAGGLERPGRVVELVQLAMSSAAQRVELTSGGVPVAADRWSEDGSERVAFIVDLPRGQAGSWRLRYTVPVEGGRYTLRLIPQPLAHPAALELSVQAAEGTWLRLRGADADGDWTSVREVVAEVEQPGLLTRMRERIKRFWNEPVRI